MISPILKKLTKDTRTWIRISREDGTLPIPKGLRVSVTSSPGLSCSSVDVTIVDAPRDWALTEHRDQWGGVGRTVSSEARAVGNAIADHVRLDGGQVYSCFVYADTVLVGSWCRTSQD